MGPLAWEHRDKLAVEAQAQSASGLGGGRRSLDYLLSPLLLFFGADYFSG
jgi:hypothetical protein